MPSSLFTGQFRVTVSDFVPLRDSVVADVLILIFLRGITQSAFKCSKLTIETLEQVVKYVQS